MNTENAKPIPGTLIFFTFYGRPERDNASASSRSSEQQEILTSKGSSKYIFNKTLKNNGWIQTWGT